MEPEHNTPSHIPVMSQEVLKWLHPEPGHTVVDGTVGLGGHSLLLSNEIGPTGHLIGLDRDQAALAIAQETLKDAPSKVTLIHSRFSEMDVVLERKGLGKVDRILLDIGVSSLQLDEADRGFSFRFEGPLDMRMDRSSGESATDLIATLSEEELAGIIWEFGEERFSRRIAKRVVAARTSETINTTKRLADLIEEVIPRRGRIHPATRTFQALRIVVNDELGELKRGLEAARASLRPNGRFSIISFHSLEDRMIKWTTREWAADGKVKLLSKKVIKPSREECVNNRRARSAKLRIVEACETTT